MEESMLKPQTERQTRSEAEKQNLMDEIVKLRENLRSFLLRHIKGYQTNKDISVDDLVQETMLKATRGIDNFREDAQLRSWLFGIGLNVLKDFYKKNPKKVLFMDDLAEEVSDRNGDDVPSGRDKRMATESPEGDYISRIDLEKFKSRLEELKSELIPNEIEVLNLRQKGYSFGEIAKMLNITRSAAKGRFFRSVEKLRDKMGHSKQPHL